MIPYSQWKGSLLTTAEFPHHCQKMMGRELCLGRKDPTTMIPTVPKKGTPVDHITAAIIDHITAAIIDPIMGLQECHLVKTTCKRMKRI
jgi:hypothetical protein